jgi:hypothetical protein
MTTLPFKGGLRFAGTIFLTGRPFANSKIVLWCDFGKISNKTFVQMGQMGS